jgi:hypothetical protein
MKESFKSFCNKVHTPDIVPTIKELSEIDWHSGKKTRMEAVKKLAKIAESDERVGGAYMKALNKAAKTIGEECIKRVNNGYFSIKPLKKPQEVTPIKDSTEILKESTIPNWEGKVPGKYKVDMNVVSKSDSSSSYIKLVKDEIKKGNGFLSIHEYDKPRNKVGMYAYYTNNYLMGLVWLPAEAITEVK